MAKIKALLKDNPDLVFSRNDEYGKTPLDRAAYADTAIPEFGEPAVVPLVRWRWEALAPVEANLENAAVRAGLVNRSDRLKTPRCPAFWGTESRL